MPLLEYRQVSGMHAAPSLIGRRFVLPLARTLAALAVIASELLKTMTGIEMTHIPYKGTAQAINDVVAGHVPIIFSDLAPAMALIRDGRLRPLGISSATRFA